MDRRNGRQYVAKERESKIFSYYSAKKEVRRFKEETAALNDFWPTVLKYVIMLAGAVLTAFFIFQAYPKNSHSWLAWIALAPFFIGIRQSKTFFGCVFYGLFTGFLVNLFLFYWIYFTCIAGGLAQWQAAGAWAALSLIIALQFALFSGVCFYARKVDYIFPLLVGTTWVAFEFLHMALAQNLLGFPWFMLGYSQWNNVLFLQIAGVGGVYAISFVLAFVSGAAANIITVKSFRGGLLLILMCAIVAGGSYVYGKGVLERARPPAGPSFKATVLQPNIDQYKKWNAMFVAEIEDRITALIDGVTDYRPDIIVWPETALPGPAFEDHYREWVADKARQTDAYQLLGSTLVADDSNFVSAFLFNREGEIESVYNKIRLVPFGEYVPFKNHLRNFDIEVLGMLGEFTSGGRFQALQEFDEIKFGTVICYESIFPKLWRDADIKGAQLFINITNDGWYLDTSAPYQHLAANVIRAVEFGKPVIRSANTGISAFIDGHGQFLEYAPLNEEAALNFTATAEQAGPKTVYARHGDIFAFLCIAISFMLAFAALLISDE